MNGNTPDIVRVRLELVDTLERVIVEHAHVHVVTARDDPILARDKLGGSNRQITHFKRFNQRLALRIPHVHMARV